jgi:hypothetical protein
MVAHLIPLGDELASLAGIGAESRAALVSSPPTPIEALARWARFPQGLPVPAELASAEEHPRHGGLDGGVRRLVVA